MAQPILSSSNMKREILANSEVTGIRKRMMNELNEAQKGDYVKMGVALEALTETEGWVYLQEYMMKHIMNSVLNDTDDGLKKGFINIMHFIDQVIRTKNEIKAKEAGQ